MRHKKRNKAAQQVLLMSAVLLIALTALLAFGFTQVFRVRRIQIVGNRNLYTEEIVTLSGVQLGDHLWDITADGLRSKLEANRYVQYDGHSFDYLGTLTIHITERQGRAVVRAGGWYYVLDESGMVLENVGEAYPDNVAGPNVMDLQQRSYSYVSVGERFPVNNEAQLDAMQKVLEALDKTGMLADVAVLNLKNLDNIYFMTTEGTSVELGDDSHLEAKMLVAREVLSIREPLGDLMGAKIDVSNEGRAHYIPAQLPTPTPVPTATPTIAPEETPKR